MKKILGVDQSYNGCAYNVVIESGDLLEFGIIRTDKTKTAFERALSAALEICDLYEKHKPDIVHMEGLAFAMRGDATRDLAGLLFTIVNTLALKHPDAPYILIPPTSVKKFATGSGKADKAQMIAALPEDVRQKYVEKNYKKTTGMADLADSYFIARFRK